MKATQRKQPSTWLTSQPNFFFIFLMLSAIANNAFGFQSKSPFSLSHSKIDMRHNAAIVDIVDISAVATTGQNVVDFSTSPALSAILASTIDFSAGASSIHPAVQAASSATPETIQQLLPAAGDAVQAQAQQALTNGWKVLDATKFVHGGGSTLPGFSETNSALAPHVIPYPMSGTLTPSDFPQYEVGDRMASSFMLLQYVQKLPYIAFAYAIVEFFFLRSDVDIYKEEAEDDPSGVLADTVSDTSVRVALFFVVSLMFYVIT